jgi:cbb3-type cytochrome oxidase subunit 3
LPPVGDARPRPTVPTMPSFDWVCLPTLLLLGAVDWAGVAEQFGTFLFACIFVLVLWLLLGGGKKKSRPKRGEPDEGGS